MTMTNGGGSTPTYTTTGSPPPAGARAAETKDAAAQGAREVASQTTKQAGELARDALGEARNVADRARGEAMVHADTQAQKAAGGMRMLSDQLRALANGRPDEAGRAGQFARDAIEPLQRWAERLEQGGVAGLSDEAARMAKRRPAMFLATCAGLGFLTGRVVKATRAVSQSPSNGVSTGSMYPPAYPVSSQAAYDPVYPTTGVYGTTTAAIPPVPPVSPVPTRSPLVEPTGLGSADALFESDAEPGFGRASAATDVPPTVSPLVDPDLAPPAGESSATRGTRGR